MRTDIREGVITIFLMEEIDAQNAAGVPLAKIRQEMDLEKKPSLPVFLLRFPMIW